MDEEKKVVYSKEEMLRNIALEKEGENKQLHELVAMQQVAIDELQKRLDYYSDNLDDEMNNVLRLKDEYEIKLKELNDVVEKYRGICREMQLQHSAFKKKSNGIMRILQGLSRGVKENGE